ncbi:MAG: two-component system sensor histidine kinase NtrB [Candidatus Bathyarchaeia archaeon]
MSGKRALKDSKPDRVSRLLSKLPKGAAYDSWVDAFRSDRKQIVTFFSRMLDAFVYCRIITNDAGKPVDYVYLGLNDAYERLIGVKREDILGKKATEVFPGLKNDPADWIDTLGKVALTGKATTVENFVPTANIWVHASIYSPQKGYFVEIFEDVTERKNLEAKLEDYTKNLENIVEERTKQLKDSERLSAIGQTAAMVGHDIRNPLQSILGELYLAKSELPAITEKDVRNSLTESIQNIENDIAYINKILQDLQDFAKPIRVVAREADLQEVIDDVVKKSSVPETIKVSIRVVEDAKKVVADPDLLKRILGNLVINAVQAMPEGGTLDISSYQEPGDTIITVQDTGSGIPEAVKSKLFTPMFTTKSKGQGFGLAIVKRMTEALNGTVTFESEEGKGTKFIVHLPPRKK